MAILGTDGERYIPVNSPPYKPAPVKVPAKKPTVKKPTYKAPTVAGSRVVSSRLITKPTPKPTTVKPTTTKPTTTTTAPPNLATLTNKYLTDVNSQINKIYDQQKATQLASFNADKTATINKLNAQKKDTSVAYQGQRNQADVVSAQNVQKLRELMAANGLNASGENVTAQAGANSDRQNSINALNLQEQSAVRDINNQINDQNNPARQQAAVAQIEAQRAQALLEGKNTAEEKAWREYTYNNMSASDKAQLDWAKQQYGEDAAWKMFELKYTTEATNAQNQTQVQAYTGGNATGTGGVSGPATFQTHMQTAIKRGVPAEWAPLLSEIVRRESSYNPGAKNPTSTAYGYAQFLASTRQQYEQKTGLSYNDPVNQLIMMYQYVKDRYGTPQNALAFWNKNHWY